MTETHRRDQTNRAVPYFRDNNQVAAHLWGKCNHKCTQLTTYMNSLYFINSDSSHEWSKQKHGVNLSRRDTNYKWATWTDLRKHTKSWQGICTSFHFLSTIFTFELRAKKSLASAASVKHVKVLTWTINCRDRRRLSVILSAADVIPAFVLHH
jgi:hypothetical protein